MKAKLSLECDVNFPVDAAAGQLLLAVGVLAANKIAYAEVNGDGDWTLTWRSGRALVIRGEDLPQIDAMPVIEKVR